MPKMILVVLIFICPIAALVSAITVGYGDSNNTHMIEGIIEVQNGTIYSNEYIEFEIPFGWDILTVEKDSVLIKSNESNDSAIRIGVVRVEDMDSIIQSGAKKINQKNVPIGARAINESMSFLDAYKNTPWYVVNAVVLYIMEEYPPIAFSSDTAHEHYSADLFKKGYIGILDNFKPNHNPKNFSEGYAAWTKPEYNNTIIFIHGIFPIDVECQEIQYYYDTFVYPNDFYSVLESIIVKTDNIYKDSVELI